MAATLRLLAVVLGVLGLSAGAAEARQLLYTADLRGDAPTSNTGSHATGQARIVVDTDAQTVDITLDVTGMTIDNLWDTLVARPIGPIHLHLYGAHNHMDPNANVSLVFPVPFGATYSVTPTGFHVSQQHATYAWGAHLLGSTTPFDQFLASMNAGDVVFNIHTDAFHDGEISGVVTPLGG